MTPPEAKRLVVVGTMGAGVLSVVAAYRKSGGASPRIAVGVFATGTMLAIGAELAPGIAGSMAILMLVTAAFVIGGDAWAGITEATKASSSAPAAPIVPRPTGK
jgi:hypothetical protein